MATLKLVKGAWQIDCEPHVSMDLKRLFGKLDKSKADKHLLADIPENALKLTAFDVMTGFDINDEDRIYLEQRAREHKETQRQVKSLLAGNGSTQTFELAEPPRNYQQVAATMGLVTKGFLLADPLGSGKTISAICMFADPSTRPVLVVTLTHLTRQWQREVNRFIPELKTHIIEGTTPYDLSKGPRASKNHNLDLFQSRFPDVIICNYQKLAPWVDVLAGSVSLIVFDEGQELRRKESQKYEAAKEIADKANFRIALSGTPFYNFGGEMWNVMNCTAPGKLGTWDEFKREWCTDTWEDRKVSLKNPRAFGTYLRDSGLMLRRTLDEIGRESPKVTSVSHPIDADQGALDRVSVTCKQLAEAILQPGAIERGAKMKMAEEFSNRLRQATGIAKAVFVAEFVKMIIENGEKVLLAGWHREVYAIWRDRLQEYRPRMFTGSESPNEKEKSIRAFVEGDCPVLMMSLRSGVGVDGLQKACRTVVIGELDWSPAVHEQLIGRIARDGQESPVTAYYLIAETGSDPVVADVCGLKQSQISGVRDPKKDLIERLQTDGNHVRRLAESYLAKASGAGVSVRKKRD